MRNNEGISMNMTNLFCLSCVLSTLAGVVFGYILGRLLK